MNKERLELWKQRLPEVVLEYGSVYFDMLTYQHLREDEVEWKSSVRCCTVACAAGFLPAIFPDARKTIPARWDSFVEDFFKITTKEADHITEPRCYGNRDSKHITSTDVALHIQDVLDGRIA